MLFSSTTIRSTRIPAFFVRLLVVLASYTFSVNALADPQIVNPSAGSTLSGSGQIFTWNIDGADIERVWLYVGTTIGGRDIANSGDLGLDTEYHVIGIPLDGSPIHARLWYYSVSRWFYIDSSYTVADLDVEISTPTMDSPVNNSELASTSIDFRWSDNNTPANHWWLYLGTTNGGKDIYDSGSAIRSQTSVTVDELPTDGGLLFARLWYRTAADGWKYVDSLYQLEPETEPPPPSNVSFWGNTQIAMSLSDTELGGRSDFVVSHTVRFPFSGELTSVRPFMIFVVGNEGGDSFYHKGDGGTFQITLETDDGTDNHLPTGNALAVTNNLIGIPAMYNGSGPADAIVGGDSGDDDNFRNFKFRSPARVEAGKLYHLVFRNTTIDPTAHFVSANDFISSRSERSLNMPTKEPYDQAVMYKSGDSWIRRENHWAIGEYLFADGRAFGNGYMEIGSVSGPDRAARYVSPVQSVRQMFKPNEDLAINSINIGAMHVNGANAVDVKLKDASGNTVVSTRLSGFPTGIPSGDARGNASLGTAEFRGASIPATYLSKDQAYFLEVMSTGGTSTVVGTRDGSIDYKFSSQSTVPGHAQLRTEPAGEWLGWPVRDTNVRKNFDISFYFGLIDG